MTTNVFDSLAGMIATDSRWSQSQGRWLAYVDDVRLDKLQVYKSFAFVFAGDGGVIQLWKDWIASVPTDFSALPMFDGIVVWVANTQTRALDFTRGENILRDGGYFAGTGSIPAYTCWATNKDARKSVESAKKADPRTGGETRFFNLVDGQNNLTAMPSNKITIQTVNEAIAKRGIIMDMGAGNGSIPFDRLKTAADAGASDADLVALQAKLSSGAVKAEAPCDAMYTTWTDDEKGRLKTVLSNIFEMKL
jgi:hypothetical protein